MPSSAASASASAAPGEQRPKRRRRTQQKNKGSAGRRGCQGPARRETGHALRVALARASASGVPPTSRGARMQAGQRARKAAQREHSYTGKRKRQASGRAVRRTPRNTLPRATTDSKHPQKRTQILLRHGAAPCAAHRQRGERHQLLALLVEFGRQYRHFVLQRHPGYLEAPGKRTRVRRPRRAADRAGVATTSCTTACLTDPLSMPASAIQERPLVRVRLGGCLGVVHGASHGDHRSGRARPQARSPICSPRAMIAPSLSAGQDPRAPP